MTPPPETGPTGRESSGPTTRDRRASASFRGGRGWWGVSGGGVTRTNSTPRPVRVPKPWGYELIFARTERYVGKILHIRKGRRLSLQFHKKKEESILVVDGKLQLTYGPHPNRLSTRILKRGQTFHVTPRLVHRFHALETCSLFEVSTPELSDVVRLQDDYGRRS